MSELSVGFVVQSDFGFSTAMDLCMSTWSAKAADLGYAVHRVNYKNFYDKSFFEVIEQVATENGLTHVVLNFDDLFFERFEIPPAKQLVRAYQDLAVEAIRLDARPPGSGDKVLSRASGLEFRHAGKTEYANSLVLASFTLSAIRKICFQSIVDPWEYEKSSHQMFGTLVLNNRTARYTNLIVKNKVDLLALYKIKDLRLSMKHTVWRLGRRTRLAHAIIRAGRRFRALFS